jgi:hypothetical protein
LSLLSLSFSVSLPQSSSSSINRHQFALTETRAHFRETPVQRNSNKRHAY